MDTVNARLLALSELDDAAAVRALAQLYRDRGFTIREDGDQAWLEHDGKSVSLNDAVGEFRHANLYELTNAFIRLPMRAGYDMRDIQLHVQMQINGDEFEMEPFRGSGGANTEILGRNVELIDSLVRKANAKFLLLTYASNQHFYGQVNLALRQAAGRYDLPLLDLQPVIEAQCPDETCTAFFFPDYHPNAEGYRRIATLIADRLVPADATDAHPVGE